MTDSKNFNRPQVGEDKRGEDGHVGYLLRQAAAAHRHRIEKSLDDLGLTAAQFTVLTMLAAYPGASGAELARLALLTPQTVNAIVANLEKARLIIRRPHRTHGRIHQLDLTESGVRALRAARERVHRLDAALLRGLSPTAERSIRRWLVAAAH